MRSRRPASLTDIGDDLAGFDILACGDTNARAVRIQCGQPAAVVTGFAGNRVGAVSCPTAPCAIAQHYPHPDRQHLYRRCPPPFAMQRPPGHPAPHNGISAIVGLDFLAVIFYAFFFQPVPIFPGKQFHNLLYADFIFIRGLCYEKNAISGFCY